MTFKPLIPLSAILLLAACAPKKAPAPPAPSAPPSMSTKDVAHIIENFHSFVYAGTESRFLLEMDKAEYDAFVFAFQNKLSQVGSDKFDYQSQRSSTTGKDDKLAYFATQLGRDKYADLTITGTMDFTNERLLIRVFHTDMHPYQED
ncbi:hypothetical protein Rhal01_02538 [Rubritalea halochordaticola]|uniref:DUF3887 domain-containing protein n=1 Tax=Rubritalea halochordaticola TaxID=714537 RepID=A0ABP9V2Y5_9BACT